MGRERVLGRGRAEGTGREEGVAGVVGREERAMAGKAIEKEIESWT